MQTSFVNYSTPTDQEGVKYEKLNTLNGVARGPLYLLSRWSEVHLRTGRKWGHYKKSVERVSITG